MAKIGLSAEARSGKPVELTEPGRPETSDNLTICGYDLSTWKSFNKQQRFVIANNFLAINAARVPINREFAHLVVSEENEGLTVCGLSCNEWNSLSPKERVRKAGIYFFAFSLEATIKELIK